MKHAPLKMLAGTAFALLLASTPALASDNSSSSDQPKAAPLYPNATRKEPKNDLTDTKEQKTLNEGIDAANAGDQAKATQILQPLIDSSKSNYVKAKSLEILGVMQAKNHDMKDAIDLMKRAVDTNALPNDDYYQLQLQLANFYLVNQQNQLVIDTLEKWRNEGRSDNADSHGWEGEAYYGMKNYPQAITELKKAQSMTDKPDPNWNQFLLQAYNDSGQKDQAAQIAQKQLAENTNNPAAFENSVTLLLQTQKYPEALQMLEKGRAQGTLKSEQDYVILTKLYINRSAQADDPTADSNKAIDVLQEGMSKGIVPSNTANNELLGDAESNAGQYDAALTAYKKAMTTATTGDVAVKAGRVLLTQDKYSEAKTLIQQGIDKGVKQKGVAYLLLANANIGLKLKPDAIAAAKLAQKDPETASKATAWLQKAGAN